MDLQELIETTSWYSVSMHDPKPHHQNKSMHEYNLDKITNKILLLIPLH